MDTTKTQDHIRKNFNLGLAFLFFIMLLFIVLNLLMT